MGKVHLKCSGTVKMEAAERHVLRRRGETACSGDVMR